MPRELSLLPVAAAASELGVLIDDDCPLEGHTVDPSVGFARSKGEGLTDCKWTTDLTRLNRGSTGRVGKKTVQYGSASATGAAISTPAGSGHSTGLWRLRQPLGR